MNEMVEMRFVRTCSHDRLLHDRCLACEIIWEEGTIAYAKKLLLKAEAKLQKLEETQRSNRVPPPVASIDHYDAEAEL